MDKLLLTDDEAAALALHCDGAWAAPLPTIDVTDRAQVVSAVLRGRRSLFVRDLATPAGEPTGQAADMIKRLGTGPRAWFMMQTADGSWFHRGLTLYLYGPSATDIELSHLVAPAGVHHLTASPPPGQWQALTAIAETIHADGFTAEEPGVPAPAAALLAVARRDAPRTVRVAKGTVTTGRGPVPARFPSVADAVAWLFT